jgi:hypothetical protein
VRDPLEEGTVKRIVWPCLFAACVSGVVSGLMSTAYYNEKRDRDAEIRARWIERQDLGRGPGDIVTRSVEQLLVALGQLRGGAFDLYKPVIAAKARRALSIEDATKS